MGAAVIQALRTGGADVLTAREAGMTGRSDDEHLTYCA